MDLDFSPREEAYRQELRELLAQHLPEHWQGFTVAGDEAWQFTVEFSQLLGERGWLTHAWPREYGGREASIWEQAVLQEEMWAHHEPRGPQYMNVNWIGPAIMHFGTAEQKAEHLPRMAGGQVKWAQGFSEPGAGSDLASLQCRADVTPDGFIVYGQKIWVSYADIADYCFLVCRTEPGSRRKNGLSVLLVDMKLPGVVVRPIPSVLGVHRIHEIFFDEVHVPRSALLGPLNDGWRVTTTALAFERSGTSRYARSARILGLLERENGDSWGEREIEAFVDVLAFGRTTELMNYRVMGLKEQGEVPRWEASAARIHNALLEQQLSDFTERVLGTATLLAGDDAATVAEGEPENLWRNAAAATITAGSYEIQMGIIASAALGLSRD